jgi:hypothetical protein
VIGQRTAQRLGTALVDGLVAVVVQSVTHLLRIRVGCGVVVVAIGSQATGPLAVSVAVCVFAGSLAGPVPPLEPGVAPAGKLDRTRLLAAPRQGMLARTRVGVAGVVDTVVAFRRPVDATLLALLAVGPGVAGVAGAHHRPGGIVTASVTAAAGVQAGLVLDANFAFLVVPGHAFAASGYALLVYAPAVFGGTGGVQGTGVCGKALAVAVVLETRGAELATLTSIASVTLAYDLPGRIVTVAMAAAGIRLA